MVFNRSYFYGVIALVALVLLVVGCEDTVEFVNAPPSDISITRSKCVIWTGGEINLTATALDEDEDPLTFTWDASAGTFSTPGATGQEVTWTAPDNPGTVVITVTVSDDIDERSLSVAVDVGEEFPALIFGTVEIVDRGYPYILTNEQPVPVSASSNLTLGPGVELIVDGEFGGLDVRGILNVEGRANDEVRIKPNSCTGVTKSWGGIYLTGKSASATIKHMNIYDGKDGIQLVEGATATIDSSSITDHNEAGISVIEGSSASITNCKIWDNGTGVYVTNSGFTLLNSNLRYNRHRGINITVITDEPTTYTTTIAECVIANNGYDGILLVGEASPTIHECSLYFNGPEVGEGYALRLGNYVVTDTVHAENNYWGDTTAAFISEQIYDRKDDPDRVKAYVGFTPWRVTDALGD